MKVWILQLLRRRKLTVDEIANKACRDLKEGWEINIHLENGEGYVSLIDSNGNEVEYDIGELTMEDQIEQCIIASNILPV